MRDTTRRSEVVPVSGLGLFWQRLLIGGLLSGLACAGPQASAPSRAFPRLTALQKKAVLVPDAGGTSIKPRFAPAGHIWFGTHAIAVCKHCPSPLVLGPSVSASFGEIIAAGGDYFADIDQLRALARTPSGAAQINYVLANIRVSEAAARFCDVVDEDCIRERQEEVARRQAEAAQVSAADRAEALARGHQLDAVNYAHFPNSDLGDLPADGTPFDEAQYKAAYLAKLRRPGTNAASYRKHHKQALQQAYLAGKNQTSPNDALATEAFGLHFLTDAFPAGHVRTARRGVAEYWNQRSPGFFAKFKEYMAEGMADSIKRNHWWSFIFSKSYLRGKARSEIDNMLRQNGIPDFNFGDLVGMAFHDYDNVHGLQVVAGFGSARSEGELQGEAIMELPDPPACAVDFMEQAGLKAVTSSVEGLMAAYEAGQKGHAESVLSEADVTEAEMLLPMPASASPSSGAFPWTQATWQKNSWQDLLKEKPAEVAIKLTLAEKRAMIESIANSMPSGYKRDALFDAIIEPLKNDSIQVLKAVLAGPAPSP